MIKCIGLDLDNTLYPEEQYYSECYRVIAEREFDGDMAVAQFMSETRQKQGDSRVFQIAQQRYGKDTDFIGRCIDIYHSCNANIQVYPDAEMLLKHKIEGIQYDLLTNGGSATQRNKIRCLGIEQSFDYVCITGGHLPKDKWKPNILAFNLLVKATGYKPSEILYVGDSIAKDADGAFRAGMQVVLADRDRCYTKAKYRRVTKLTELEEVVKEKNKSELV